MALLQTPTLGIPLMSENALQKEVLFNEAVLTLDAAFAGVVQSVANDPPSSPADGEVHIVGTSPTGAWAGKANAITFYYNGWQFFSPPGYMQVFNVATAGFWNWNGTVWAAGVMSWTSPLTGLSDVAVTEGPAIDGQALYWDNAASKWKAGPKRVDLPINTVAGVSGAVTLNRANGEYQALTLTGNVTALTVTGWPAAGTLGKLTLDITNGASFSITWPGSTKWPRGLAPTLTPTGRDLVLLMSIDGGTTVLGNTVGQAYA